MEGSGSFARLLQKLLESTALGICERWFRICYRGSWILAASAVAEPRSNLLLAFDNERRVIGADRGLRHLLYAGGRHFTPGLALTHFFEGSLPSSSRRHHDDSAGKLRNRFAPGDWNVLVTPPELATAVGGALRRLHVRPRLGLSDVAVSKPSEVSSPYALAPRLMRRVTDYIDSHLGSSLRIEVLAAQVGTSASYFSRCFRASFGLTPHRYVLERRLARAQTLLATSTLRLTEVALTAGFADQSHFCRRFREAVGSSPSHFRKQHR
jgi:AraC-like DNA-binding protein